MKNRQPEFLKKGDCVAIVATARWLNQGEESKAKELLEAAGLVVEVFPEVFEKEFQLAGNDETRANSLQRAVDDERYRAILIARGGYGTVRILDRLDFTKWLQRPSWICGYSDITALLGHIERLGVAGIHSTMPISFPVATDEALNQLVDSLMGKHTHQEWRSEYFSDLALSGKLIGGNLSVLYSLVGSVSYPNTSNSILLLEDVDEMIYHIDRMMEGLRRSGGLNGVKAILLGGLTQMRDNTLDFGFSQNNPFGETAESAIMRVAKSLEIPVIPGFPTGHQNDNRPFYHGMEVELVASNGTVVVKYY
jgi:muramoyltetrapeptide carboxypeptidase